MGGRRLSGVARGREEKRRIANGEWRIGMVVERFIDQFVSGPEGVARCHSLGGALLPTDAAISSRRAVRIDVANQARSGVGSGQHCGRSRAGKYRQLRAASANLAGLSERAGNASAFGGARRYSAGAGFATGSRSVRELGQNASCFDTVAAGQGCEMMPFAIRHSPFAKARSASR
jgi:hypothetical protein